MTAHPRPRPPASNRPGSRRPCSPPTPDRLVALLARTWLEVLAGRRQLQQLAPLVSRAVLQRLEDQLPTGIRRGAVGRIRRVRVCEPHGDAVEACVLVELDGRVTALALRLQRHLGAWRVTEFTAPEAGLPALTTSVLPPGWRPRDAFDEVLEAG
jgi:hypothetical protein